MARWTTSICMVAAVATGILVAVKEGRQTKEGKETATSSPQQQTA